MILREFIDNINEFVKENPKALDMLVITSKDDEGNGFTRIYYGPSIGVFDSGNFKDEDDSGVTANAVCVN